MKGLALLLGITLLLVAVWLRGCAGPRPSVAQVEAALLGAPGARYQVRAIVQNQGRGEGQVQVILRLRDPDTGRTWQTDRSVELQPGERTEVAAPLDAPPGDWVPEAEARYPP